MQRPPPRSRPRGFVLPITVILLALVAVGVALMSQRSDQMRALVLASRQEQQAAVSVQNHLAHAMFLSSTLLRRGSRLGAIELDGRFYRGSDGTLVAYQDAGGLFNLRRASAVEIAGLLRALRVDERQVAALADALLDYVDADHLARVNGAEAAEYGAARLPPPRNAPLLAPGELQRVAGWHRLDAATQRAVIELVWVGPVGPVSRHTVKPAVLAAIGGVDLATARDLIAQREAGQPLAIELLPIVARGSYLSAGRFVTLPSATTLLTICPPAVAWCQHVGLTATADGEAPWHVDFSRRQMRVSPLPPPDKLAALPDQAPPPAPTNQITPFANLQ